MTMEITAREFFCGAYGLSRGVTIDRDYPKEKFNQVMEGVAVRYEIPIKDAHELCELLEKEFARDADSKK